MNQFVNFVQENSRLLQWLLFLIAFSLPWLTKKYQNTFIGQVAFKSFGPVRKPEESAKQFGRRRMFWLIYIDINIGFFFLLAFLIATWMDSPILDNATFQIVTGFIGPFIVLMIFLMALFEAHEGELEEKREKNENFKK